MRSDIGDYIAADYTSHGKYLDDDAYAAALDSLVFACIDVLPMVGGKVLIALRTRHPQADWWMFGGRIRTGETLHSAAQRLMEIEMGIRLQEDRFDYLTTWVAAWKTRAQAPVDHGTHNVSITMSLELTEDELSRVHLNDEYSAMKLIGLDELIASDDFHPALRQCALAWQNRLAKTIT